jgi:hypothetical protein
MCWSNFEQGTGFLNYAEPGHYDLRVYLVDDSICQPVYYRAVVTPLPLNAPGAMCIPDFSITLTDSGYHHTATTCGAGDDSPLHFGADHIYQFDVGTEANYTFSLCGSATNWNTLLNLCTYDCQNVIASNNNACGVLSELRCVRLWPGRYWLILDPGLNETCKPYTLDVTRCCSPTPVTDLVVTLGAADPDRLTNDVYITFSPAGGDPGVFHVYRGSDPQTFPAGWQRISPEGGLTPPGGMGSFTYCDHNILTAEAVRSYYIVTNDCP